MEKRKNDVDPWLWNYYQSIGGNPKLIVKRACGDVDNTMPSIDDGYNGTNKRCVKVGISRSTRRNVEIKEV